MSRDSTTSRLTAVFLAAWNSPIRHSTPDEFAEFIGAALASVLAPNELQALSPALRRDIATLEVDGGPRLDSNALASGPRP